MAYMIWPETEPVLVRLASERGLIVSPSKTPGTWITFEQNELPGTHRYATNLPWRVERGGVSRSPHHVMHRFSCIGLKNHNEVFAHDRLTILLPFEENRFERDASTILDAIFTDNLTTVTDRLTEFGVDAAQSELDYARELAARFPWTPVNVLTELASDPNRRVRSQVVANKNTPQRVRVLAQTTI